MTTDRPLAQVPGPPRGVSRPGERLVRLRRRRRLVREEFLAVAVLLLLLAVTVAVLATQWLASSPSAASQSASGAVRRARPHALQGRNFMIQSAGPLR